jgi:hypothetical protein
LYADKLAQVLMSLFSFYKYKKTQNKYRNLKINDSYFVFETKVILHIIKVWVGLSVDGPPFQVSPEYDIEERLFIVFFGGLEVVRTHLVDELLLRKWFAPRL